MLEDLDLDDLAVIAETLPGPPRWTWATDDIFCCRARFTAFEFGVEPVPGGPCEPIDPAALTEGVDENDVRHDQA